MAKKQQTIICQEKQCRKEVLTPLNNRLISPFEVESTDIQSLFAYFLHRAPNVESVHSPQIESNLHTQIFDSMFQGRHFEHMRFCASNAKIEDELERLKLNGDGICLKCKRFVCKRTQTVKGGTPETNLCCFLRHIRNSIAHGRVYYEHAGNRVFVVFEDINSNKKLSARIICIKADLIHWRKILEKASTTGKKTI